MPLPPRPPPSRRAGAGVKLTDNGQIPFSAASFASPALAVQLNKHSLTTARSPRLGHDFLGEAGEGFARGEHSDTGAAGGREVPDIAGDEHAVGRGEGDGEKGFVVRIGQGRRVAGGRGVPREVEEGDDFGLDRAGKAEARAG